MPPTAGPLCFGNTAEGAVELIVIGIEAYEDTYLCKGGYRTLVEGVEIQSFYYFNEGMTELYLYSEIDGTLTQINMMSS